jgi:hypothetical protein
MGLISFLLQMKAVLLVVAVIVQQSDRTMARTELRTIANYIQELETRLETIYNSNNMAEAEEAERRLSLLYNLENVPESERLLPLLAPLGEALVSLAAPTLIQKGGEFIQGAVKGIAGALSSAPKGASRTVQVAAVKKATKAAKQAAKKAKAKGKPAKGRKKGKKAKRPSKAKKGRGKTGGKKRAKAGRK